MNTNRLLGATIRWGLWLFVNGVGYVITFVVYLALLWVMLPAGLGYGIPALVSVAVYSVVQWFALVGRIPVWWVMASAAGNAIGIACVYGAFVLERVALGGAIAGLVVGVFQWAILQLRYAKSGWWVLASTVGWCIGSIMMNNYVSDQYIATGVEYLYLWPLIMFPAPVIAIATGFPLFWLFLKRRTRPAPQIT